MDNLLQWTFVNEIDAPQDILELLTPDEEVVASFQTVRDVAGFTTKRLIVMDSQGITGRKKEVYSLPYSSILMWSTENAGTFDFNGEIELWTRVGNFKISLRKGIDVRQFEILLADAIL